MTPTERNKHSFNEKPNEAFFRVVSTLMEHRRRRRCRCRHEERRYKQENNICCLRVATTSATAATATAAASPPPPPPAVASSKAPCELPFHLSRPISTSDPFKKLFSSAKLLLASVPLDNNGDLPPSGNVFTIGTSCRARGPINSSSNLISRSRSISEYKSKCS